MISNLWFELYRPKSINDIIIPENKRKAVIEWFDNFKAGNTSQCAMLFTGPPGLGKTSLAHIILNEFGYHVKEFNASDIRSKSLIHENLYSLINIKNVQYTVGTRDKRPIGIIMDEVDGMFKGDRGGVDELISFITIPSNRKKREIKNNNRTVPIICICNIGSVKKETINNLKKECFTVEFTKPNFDDMLSVLERVTRNENMNLTPDAKKSVIEFAQFDFRRLVCLLEFIHSYHGDVMIDHKELDQCYDILCFKEQDLYVTDAIKEMLNNKLTPPQVQSIYNNDKSKTPMVIHQNYLRAISAQKTNIQNKMQSSIETIDSLIRSDIIEKIMYNTQNWNLQYVQAIASTHIPNYYINKYGKRHYIDARWASILSVNSQAQNLRKNMYIELNDMATSHGKSYSVEDLQHIIELIFHFLINGHTIKAVELMARYNICTDLKNKGKKALPVIDKMAKYIKLSLYYDQWTKFLTKNKNNKELDTEIQQQYQKITTTIIETAGDNINIPTPKPKPQPKSKSIEQQQQLANSRRKIRVQVRVKDSAKE